MITIHRLLLIPCLICVSSSWAAIPDGKAEVAGTLQILDNRHPRTGTPVFEKDGIAFEELEDYLDRFTYSVKTASATERERLTALYLRLVIDIPSRFGGAAGYYLKMVIYRTRDGRARFDFSPAVQRRVVVAALVDQYHAIHAAGVGSSLFGYYEGIIGNFDLRDAAVALVEIGQELRTDPELRAQFRAKNIDHVQFERFCLSLVEGIVSQNIRIGRFDLTTPALIQALRGTPVGTDETVTFSKRELLDSIEVHREHFDQLRSGSYDYATSIWGDDGPRRCDLILSRFF